jgi:hypothetical protein
MVDKRDVKVVGRVVSPIIIGPGVGCIGIRYTDIVKIADRKVKHPAPSITHPQIIGQDLGVDIDDAVVGRILIAAAGHDLGRVG